MTKVEQILNEINNLAPKERQELIKQLLDKNELLNWLKISEKAFSDWDNKEDEIYDNL